MAFFKQFIAYMGFIHAFKRWRLASRGMSSGKKRRTSTASENAMVDSMERSVWIKMIIYPLFIVLFCSLSAFSLTDDMVFHSEGVRRTLICIILSATAILFYHIRNDLRGGNGQVVLVFGGVLVHLALFRSTYYLIEMNGWTSDLRLLLPSLAFAPMIHSVLLGRFAGVFSALCVSLLGCMMMPVLEIFTFLVMSLVAGLVAVTLTRKVRRRGNVLRAGFYVGLVMLLVAMAFGKIDPARMVTQEGFGPEGIKVIVALVSGILTGMVVSGLLPLLESLFTITTSISWLEMSDLNHKLLRKLQLEAPGTYHHSMVVASLAESAAEDVGANASMCRVCSYFHDVGKLKKPEYFIENQGEINPHDALTPTMSALIIIAHVKDGVDMAIKHKLDPKIIDVIREHHGNSLVKYFYHKARELRRDVEQKVEEGIENKEDIPEVDRKNFRYPGPLPSTRESGIISLADSVESASRSIKKPTPQKIHNLVNEIVIDKVTSGQLDNSNLTMGDIKKVCNSFCSTLRSMMHTRIDYPKDDQGDRKTSHSAAVKKNETKPKVPAASMTEKLPEVKP